MAVFGLAGLDANNGQGRKALSGRSVTREWRYQSQRHRKKECSTAGGLRTVRQKRGLREELSAFEVERNLCSSDAFFPDLGKNGKAGIRNGRRALVEGETTIGVAEGPP